VLKESLFFLAESVTVFHWGKASDRFGRKPILLLGPLGLTFMMLGFGLSSDFWMLVVFRCLQGVFNGNIGKPFDLVRHVP
jgi:MFS family permease